MLKFTLKCYTVAPTYFGLLWPSSGIFSLSLAKVTLFCKDHQLNYIVMINAVLWQHASADACCHNTVFGSTSCLLRKKTLYPCCTKALPFPQLNEEPVVLSACTTYFGLHISQHETRNGGLYIHKNNIRVFYIPFFHIKQHSFLSLRKKM
jgi:hypothetical protein